MKINSLPLEEVIEELIDYRGKTPTKTNSGVKLITAKVIKDGFIQDGPHEYIDEEEYDSWMRRGLPQKKDILITTEAPLGEVAQIRTDEKIALAQRVILLRARKDILDQSFFFHLLKSPLMQGKLKARATGTTVAGIKQSELRQVQISFPSLFIQRQIASILSAYDDLIENNTRRIKILEEIAWLIYREWFVEFKAPGIKLRKATTEEKKVTGKDVFPVGWEVKRLEEVATITMGQSPESKYYNETGEGLPFHQGVTDFGDRFPMDRIFTTVQNRIADEGDILFSVRAPVGRINIATKKMVLGRGLSGIRSKLGQQEFLFQQLKVSFKKEDSMGGGTIFKSVTKNDMLSIRFVQPIEKLIKFLKDQAKPIFKELFLLTKQNINLRQTRDLLLPKLISGEVEV
jgi:type I restriction enzyme, S subunit